MSLLVDWYINIVLYPLFPAGKAEIAYESPEANNVAEKQNQPDSLVSSDKVLLTVVKFAEEDPILKWFLRVMSIMLLITLAFLWLFYR